MAVLTLLRAMRPCAVILLNCLPLGEAMSTLLYCACFLYKLRSRAPLRCAGQWVLQSSKCGMDMWQPYVHNILLTYVSLY